MGAKRSTHHFKLSVLAAESGVEVLRLGGIAIGVDPQGCLFHCLPPPVVEHDGEDGEAFGLCHGID